jgi:2-iminobutanoate/2-iminopropanoate deaminase
MTEIRRVISPYVPEPPPDLWSSCLVVNGVVYISGQTGAGYITDENAQADSSFVVKQRGEYAQAKEAFEKIRHLIEAAGGVMGDIVKLTIFVTDMTKRRDIWAARREFFSGDFPTVSLVQVAALASPEFVVEIDAVGYLGSHVRSLAVG